MEKSASYIKKSSFSLNSNTEFSKKLRNFAIA